MHSVTPSGVVPRDLLPGIVWDEDAEARYIEIATQKINAGYRNEFAEREARYAVEYRLHMLYQKREVSRALRCRNDSEKRELFSSWSKNYGEVRALRLANTVKSPKLRDAAMRYE